MQPVNKIRSIQGRLIHECPCCLKQKVHLLYSTIIKCQICHEPESRCEECLGLVTTCSFQQLFTIPREEQDRLAKDPEYTHLTYLALMCDGCFETKEDWMKIKTLKDFQLLKLTPRPSNKFKFIFSSSEFSIIANKSCLYESSNGKLYLSSFSPDPCLIYNVLDRYQISDIHPDNFYDNKTVEN